MSTPEPALRGAEPGSAKLKADHKRLAGLLIEVARCLNQDLATKVPSYPAADLRLEELRRIITGREQDALARLERRLDDPDELAAAVAHILPTAIHQAALRDDQLSRALAPTVESAAQLSIKKDPRTLVNILFPLMGPAIRKSIRETLANTLQSLNEALKHSLSWRGLKWRFEAYRTGTPFAAVVLTHTLVYRVEHVFLIHQRTGLLIEHVAAEQIAATDPQLVSGMLAAIQDFVRDSFAETADGGVDTLRLGELLVWSEPGPYAFLVAVIRGHPPESLHELLQGTLAKIHSRKRAALEGFDGDTAAFLDIRDQLGDCLQSQASAPERAISPLLWFVLLLPLAMGLAGGYWLFRRHQEESQWVHYVERLQAEPGIVVTGSERRDGAWYVIGLRDPLAADPNDLLAGSSVAVGQVVGHWEPYQSLRAPFVLKRMEASLDPPPTVSLTLEGDTVRAEGSAPHFWIETARRAVRSLPAGSPRLDLSSVKDLDQAEQMEFTRLRAAVESELIHFAKDDLLPEPGQETHIDAVAEKLRQLQEVTRHLRLAVRVTIVGHADSTGKNRTNLVLSMGRAEAVRSLFKAKGVDPDLLFIRAAGPLEPLQAEVSDSDRALNRRVSFTIGLIE